MIRSQPTKYRGIPCNIHTYIASTCATIDTRWASTSLQNGVVGPL